MGEAGFLKGFSVGFFSVLDEMDFGLDLEDSGKLTGGIEPFGSRSLNKLMNLKAFPKSIITWNESSAKRLHLVRHIASLLWLARSTVLDLIERVVIS